MLRVSKDEKMTHMACYDFDVHE